MNLNDWSKTFKTYVSRIWTSFHYDDFEFRETETSFEAITPNNKTFFLNKKDADQINQFVSNKKDLQLVFAIERNFENAVEIIMDFLYKKEDYRVCIVYSGDEQEFISLAVWGCEQYQSLPDVANEVSNILLEREGIRIKQISGCLNYSFIGGATSKMLNSNTN